MKKSRLISIILTLSMTIMLFVGCATQPKEQVNLATGGTLLLKVNPEIAITYDENGNVTKLESCNQDAQAILKDYTGFEGKDTALVVKDLVEKIGNAGYFVEEVEGERRHIVIEIEKGSVVPDEKFMDNVVTAVKEILASQKWYSPLDIVNGSGYGFTDYVDTDYGEFSDGVTDFNDIDYGYKNDGATDFGVTDYNDTDYGPDNDGVTDFGKTDYDTTDYGPQPTAPAVKPEEKSGQDKRDTDYGHTDYDATDYGPQPTKTPTAKPEAKPTQAPSVNNPDTDYGHTDYETTDYGKSDYN